MAKKDFTFRGKSLEEMQGMTLNEFAKLLPSRERRTINRGISDEHQKLISKLQKKNAVKTHLRDMIILPQWVDKVIKIHNGKEFQAVTITQEMIGLRLGQVAPTRNMVKHSAPGVGATRSSSAISVR